MRQFKAYLGVEQVNIRIPIEINDQLKSVSGLVGLNITQTAANIMQLGLNAYYSPPQPLKPPVNLEEIKKTNEEIEMIESLVLQVMTMIKNEKQYENICEKCLKENKSLYRKKKIEEFIFCQSCGDRTTEPVYRRMAEDIYVFCLTCAETGKDEQKLRQISLNSQDYASL